MSKVYRYRDLSFPVNDNEDVTLTIRFVSSGNTGHTVINVPGPNDPELADEGSVSLGKGSALRGDTTVSFSDIVNLVPEEDEIAVQYFLNDTLLQEHRNPKTDADSVYIVLFIKFPQAL
ncbi:hypothetical protein [Flaviaesturariibacter amylovorans]|uniref:Uncharacterized protein n=1 Tax=Flaviaesturariibacter amylovorans TaxID=1084520 RepID=A0ABP8HIC9_9BACT